MKTIEPDLTDRIADGLPADIRADFYREMRHCRSLPDNDEMLRILRIMQFFTLLMEQVPIRLPSSANALNSSLRWLRRACGTSRIDGGVPP